MLQIFIHSQFGFSSVYCRFYVFIFVKMTPFLFYFSPSYFTSLMFPNLMYVQNPITLHFLCGYSIRYTHDRWEMRERERNRFPLKRRSDKMVRDVTSLCLFHLQLTHTFTKHMSRHRRTHTLVLWRICSSVMLTAVTETQL